MLTSLIRVLVVDDFEPFRRFLSLALQVRNDIVVVSEASDGLEAVNKARELQPDLILLDIGLPKLNGIEVAQRIGKLSPKSKILFVSQESSIDVVQQALAAGNGYIVKTDAAAELLIAIDGVLRDEQFVSLRLLGRRDFIGRSHALSVAPNNRTNKGKRHEVLFYSSEERLLEKCTDFVTDAVKLGAAAVVVATKPHRDDLFARLLSRGLHVGTLVKEGRYIAIDAAHALSRIMRTDMPDPARFLKLFADLMLTAGDALKGESSKVVLFGECVHLLWRQGNAKAAIQFEKFGNYLIREYDIDILCGYSLASFQGGIGSGIFAQICAEHSAAHSQ